MNKLSKITTALALLLSAGQAHASIMLLPLNCGQFKLNGEDKAELGMYKIIITKAVAGPILNFKISLNVTPKQSRAQQQENVELLTKVGNGLDAVGNYTMEEASSGARVTIMKNEKSATLTLADGAQAICK